MDHFVILADSVGDLNTLNLEPHPEFSPNFNPDPGLYYRSIKTIFLNKGSFFKFIFKL